MTQIASVKFTKNGTDLIDLPVWENGTSTTADQYELLRFDDGVEPSPGFIAFGVSGGGEDTIEELKFEHGTHGLLCPLASLGPAYTMVEDWSNALWKNNYSIQYSSSQLVLDTAYAGAISPDSVENNTTTTGTAISLSGDGLTWGYPSYGTIELDLYFNTAGVGNMILFFAATGGQCNYRASYSNSTGTNNLSLGEDRRGCSGSLNTNYSTNATRYDNEWMTLQVIYASGVKTVNLIRKLDGSTIATTGGSYTNLDGDSGIGLALKGGGVSANSLRYTPP